MRELHESVFHKSGIYGSGRVRSNALDVFRRMPSRSSRGRRAAVDFATCFGCGGIFFVCFFFDCFFLRTNTACRKYEAAVPFYLSTSNEARPSERSDRSRFLPIGKKPVYYEARPRERSDRACFLPLGINASSCRGAYRVPLFN